jgi:hypothetical protein
LRRDGARFGKLPIDDAALERPLSARTYTACHTSVPKKEAPHQGWV